MLGNGWTYSKLGNTKQSVDQYRGTKESVDQYTPHDPAHRTGESGSPIEFPILDKDDNKTRH